MARKKYLSSEGLDFKLIIDVIAASLLVRKAPSVISLFIPDVDMSGFIGNAVGVGTGFVVGKLLNRSNLSNASIALAFPEIFGSFLPGGTTETLPGGTTETGYPVIYNPTPVKSFTNIKTTPGKGFDISSNNINKVNSTPYHY